MKDPLEKMRTAHGNGDHRIVIQEAGSLNLDGLEYEVLDDFVVMVGEAALALNDNSPDELDGYQLLVDGCERRLKAGPYRSHLEELIALALYNRGVIFAELGNHADAVLAYGVIRDRFSRTASDSIRHTIVQSMTNQSALLGRLERKLEALTVIEAVLRIADQPEDLALALYNRGVRLYDLGRIEEAVAAYQELIERFEGVEGPAIAQCIAKGLYNRYVALGDLNRHGEALAVCDDLISQFRDRPVPELSLQVAKATLAKARELHRLGQPELAIAAFNELITQFGSNPETTFQELVLEGMTWLRVHYSAFGNVAEAETICHEILRRYGDTCDPVLIERRAIALYASPILKTPTEQISACDEVIRYWRDRRPRLVARALYRKGYYLNQTKCPEEEIQSYDQAIELIRSLDLPMPALEAQALHNKALTLEERGQHKQALAIDVEIANRFRDCKDSKVRKLVAEASERIAQARHKKAKRRARHLDAQCTLSDD